jgi:hypothetical protein
MENAGKGRIMQTKFQHSRQIKKKSRVRACTRIFYELVLTHASPTFSLDAIFISIAASHNKRFHVPLKKSSKHKWSEYVQGIGRIILHCWMLTN